MHLIQRGDAMSACILENKRPGIRDALRKMNAGWHTRSCAAVISLTLTSLVLSGATSTPAVAQQQQQQQRPNIVVIMGDDIGIWNIGAYHRGMMAGRTPNLDKIAAEGMLFTDYYAEASCTAGRANFITGQLPIRTGMTTVGQAGAPIGLPAAAPTIATALRRHGLRHRPVRQEPPRRQERVPADGARLRPVLRLSLSPRRDGRPLPSELSAGPAECQVGPRNMVRSVATTTDDTTVDPRWGKVGKQKIEDAGELCPKRMETVDDEIRDQALKFLDKAKADNKPFFLWLNPTRMHIVTHLSPKVPGDAQLQERLVHPRSRHGAAGRRHRPRDEEAEGHGGRRQHHRHLHHRQRHRGLHLAGRRTDAVRAEQRHGHGRRLPRAGDDPLAGQVPAGKVENGIISGLDWFPTLLAAAGNPNIGEELKKGKQLGDRTYKVHLDGYDQTDMITGKGPSKRHEICYFGESTLGAVRIGDYKYRFIDQPGGWLGDKTKVDVPYLTNLRLDPFERTGWPESGTKNGAQQYFDWFKYEFWRFVFVQQEVAEAGR